jgi:large subunit ribosomal protein L2
MGKRLILQRRGKGSHKFKATHRATAKAEYLNLDEKQATDLVKAQVVDLVLDPARTALLAKLLYEDNSCGHIVAAEGLQLNQEVLLGKKSEIAVGNVLPLADIPEGCPIFSVEKIPGDGGSLIRSSGLYGLIVSKDETRAFIKMPSGKSLSADLRGRATIGCVSCGGRSEKPFIKAGNKYYAMKAKKKAWPRVRGVAMNPLDHPFGGAQHHAGKSKSTSRHAAAGRKVGAIASKRTGRKKK